MPTVADWSTTPASNASVLGINIAEGCDAGNLNNAIRELLAEAKTKFDAVDVSVAAAATLTGSETLTNKTLTSPALTGTPTAPTAAPGTNTTQVASTAFVGAAITALAALTVSSSSLAATGYVKLSNGLFIMWGSKSVTGGGTTTTVTYNTELSITTGIGTFSVAVISGGSTGDNNLNGPYVSGTSTTAFTVYNNGTATTVYWVAVGK